ncbi:MAG: hypothetical protein IKQ15_05400 [Kiritimatiellae bacterium]|nr:hypothetical protein [Kiritimatiellia bacterium]
MVGKLFSNGWKKRENFPMIGKNFGEFSNDWKKSFQWLEKIWTAAGHRSGSVPQGGTGGKGRKRGHRSWGEG